LTQRLLVHLLKSSRLVRAGASVLDRFGYSVQYLFVREVDNQKPFTIPSTIEIALYSGATLLDLEHVEGLTKKFLQDAIHRGDRCIVAKTANKVVGYSWSTSVAATYNQSLDVQIPAGFAYGYKAYVEESYRGHALYPELIRQVGVIDKENGLLYRLAYVAVANRSSLRGLFKLGYKPVGWFMVIGKREPYRVLRASAVKKLGFALVSTND